MVRGLEHNDQQLRCLTLFHFRINYEDPCFSKLIGWRLSHLTYFDTRPHTHTHTHTHSFSNSSFWTLRTRTRTHTDYRHCNDTLPRCVRRSNRYWRSTLYCCGGARAMCSRLCAARWIICARRSRSTPQRAAWLTITAIITVITTITSRDTHIADEN